MAPRLGQCRGPARVGAGLRARTPVRRVAPRAAAPPGPRRRHRDDHRGLRAMLRFPGLRRVRAARRDAADAGPAHGDAVRRAGDAPAGSFRPARAPRWRGGRLRRGRVDQAVGAAAPRRASRVDARRRAPPANAAQDARRGLRAPRGLDGRGAGGVRRPRLARGDAEAARLLHRHVQPGGPPPPGAVADVSVAPQPLLSPGRRDVVLHPHGAARGLRRSVRRAPDACGRREPIAGACAAASASCTSSASTSSWPSRRRPRCSVSSRTTSCNRRPSPPCAPAPRSRRSPVPPAGAPPSVAQAGASSRSSCSAAGSARCSARRSTAASRTIERWTTSRGTWRPSRAPTTASSCGASRRGCTSSRIDDRRAATCSRPTRQASFPGSGRSSRSRRRASCQAASRRCSGTSSASSRPSWSTRAAS